MITTVFVAAIALTAMLLTWALAGLGTQALSAYRTRFTRQTHFSLRELFLFADPTQLFAINVALVILAAALIWILTGNPVLALLAAAAMAVAPRLIFAFLKRRRNARIENQLPDALLMIAGAAKAGMSLSAAIRQITPDLPHPLSQEFSLMQHEQRLGVALSDSLDNFAHRLPLPSIKFMTSAMRIALDTGGALAETLERAAATLRAQHAMELKIRALTAQGKLQAWVVGLLPVFLLWVLHRMEPEAMSLLWNTRMGWGVLAAVAVMEFAGVMLIRKIVAIDV
jgi:tight adherence protein B